MSKKIRQGTDISSFLDKNPHSIFWFFNPVYEELHVVYSFSLDYSKLIHDFVISCSPNSQIVFGAVLEDGFYQSAYIVNFLAQNKILHFCDINDDTYVTKEKYIHRDLIRFYDIAIASCETKPGA